jgi:hypothetical protein
LGKMNASDDDLRDFAFKARDRQTASLENVRRPNSFLFSPRPNLAFVHHLNQSYCGFSAVEALSPNCK